MTRRFPVALMVVAAVAAAVALAAYFNIKETARFMLARAGYPHATIGAASLEAGGLELRDVTLDDGVRAGAVRVAGDFTDIVMFNWKDVSLHLRDAQFFIPAPWGAMRVQADESVIMPYNGKWRWTPGVTITTSYTNERIRLAGRMTADMEPGKLSHAHFEIETGEAKLPGLEARRITGWFARGADFTYSGQLMMGVVEGEDVRLLDAAATLEEDGTLLFSGADRTGRRMELAVKQDGVYCDGVLLEESSATRLDARLVMRQARACMGAQPD